MRARMLIVGLVAAATSGAAAKESLTLRVSPMKALAPTNLVIRASLEPDAANRALQVVVESDDFYRASTIPLAGERGPRTTNIELRTLPSGAYVVSVIAIAADGEPRAVARAHVDIIDAHSPW
jgi:hypothetical protein